MRIVEVTLSTPTAENFRGATALGYHLAKYRSSDIELHIFTFNYNGVSQQRIAAAQLHHNSAEATMVASMGHQTAAGEDDDALPRVSLHKAAQPHNQADK